MPRWLRMTIVIMGAMGVIASVLFALWYLPKWYLDTRLDSAASVEAHKLIELETSARGSLIQIFTGSFVLYGFYLTWRRIRTLERTVELTQQAQITDRYSKAIDHIGSDAMQTRLGGIYTLQQLANEADSFRRPVVEVLTAFIRNKSQEIKKSSSKKSQSSQVEDIQAALNMFRTRLYEYPGASIFEEYLSYSQRNSILNDIDLADAFLRRVNLKNARFSRARLDGCDLCSADLRDATISDTTCTETKFDGANLYSASFRSCNLRGASFRKADLYNVEFDSCDISGCDFRGALNLTLKALRSADKNMELKLDPDLSQQFLQQ